MSQTPDHDIQIALLQRTPLFDLKHADETILAAAKAIPGAAPEDIYLRTRSLWKSATSTMFHGRYYMDTNPDVKASGQNPLIHYLRNGYLEGRSPSPIVDIDYVVQQLSERTALSDPADPQRVAQEMFAASGDVWTLLRQNPNCDPNPFFSNEFYVAANHVEDPTIPPVLHYMQARGKRPEGGYLQCSTHADLQFYMSTNPDLIAADVIPLVHLLEYGISERRAFGGADNLADDDFLANTAGLYRNASLSHISKFLARSKTSQQLGGPSWPTRYTSETLPLLGHRASPGARKCFVGVVLYNNSADEIQRLHRSIQREMEEYPDYDIAVKYMANDTENLAMYAELLGSLVQPSLSGSNEGFGRAHNALMCEAFRDDNLYIGANPDGYFLPGSIRSLIDYSDALEGQALIEAAALPIDHPKWHDPVLLDTQWVSGACFAYSSRLWEIVGGFDEQIHLYCEDVDLSWRVRLAGGQLKVLPTARFMHDVTPRFVDATEDSPERRLNMLKGAYFLAAKWGQDDRAALLKVQLSTLLDPQGMLDLPEPVDPIEVEVASRVADFAHSRFAPSRFWKE